MVSGVVGNNNHRKLDPEEFRGFALADAMAPVVFVNGAESKSAQMFTLAHELAHLWLGESGVSDAGVASFPERRTEQWCNQTAAELLVPLASVKAAIQGNSQPLDQVNALARQFKVSTLVILRRVFDAGALSQRKFQEAYQAELKRLKEQARRTSGGGDYYLTQPARLSRRFARAVITSTYEGQTLFTDAFRMLGVKKEQTLRDDSYLSHSTPLIGILAQADAVIRTSIRPTSLFVEGPHLSDDGKESWLYNHGDILIPNPVVNR